MKYRILMVGQCHLHGEEILAMTQGVVQIQLSKSHGSVREAHMELICCASTKI